MTLTPRMNIWTEVLLACSVACLALILPSIVDDVYRDINLTHATIPKASILAILVFRMFAYPSEILPIMIVVVICLWVLANYNALNPSNLQTRSIKRKASNKTNELRQAYKTWNDAFDSYNYSFYTECLEDYQETVDIATSILKKEIKVESTAIEENHSEMEKIIERTHIKENTNNGQKGRNNHTSPQKTAMVTLPAAPSINKSSTTCGILKKQKGGERIKI